MLQQIQVDGFRSLIDFKVTLQPGLNVIVGANGTGKSNFISFLDFLGALIESDLNSAIAVAQGAGSMFSSERFVGDESAELTFKLKGQIAAVPEDDRPSLPFTEGKTKTLTGDYSYACTISYLASVPSVFISSENITIEQSDSSKITIERLTSLEDTTFKTTVTTFPKDHKLFKKALRYMRLSEQKLDTDQYLTERVVPERSVLPYLGNEAPELGRIMNDLTKYRSVNIDPSAARKPSPVGSAVTLNSNGEGLAGALYQLKNGVYYTRRGYNRAPLRRKLGEELFRSVISWCREVNPAIEDVIVKLDVIEAQLRPFIKFRHGLASDLFSFRRISDGTVKWLALTTVLFAEPRLSIIEEPENFLHPFMQESFVSLCRQALLQNAHRAIIISTHSPTLLDCCNPNELTIFQLVDGKTQAVRVANRDELERKLRESQFGLGHYYKIGALYGEDSSFS